MKIYIAWQLKLVKIIKKFIPFAFIKNPINSKF